MIIEHVTIIHTRCGRVLKCTLDGYNWTIFDRLSQDAILSGEACYEQLINVEQHEYKIRTPLHSVWCD